MKDVLKAELKIKIRRVGRFVVTINKIISFTKGHRFVLYAYEEKDSNKTYNGSIIVGDTRYFSTAYRKGNTNDHFREAYRIIETAFPEVLNKGSNSDGRKMVTFEEIKKTGLLYLL